MWWQMLEWGVGGGESVTHTKRRERAARGRGILPSILHVSGACHEGYMEAIRPVSDFKEVISVNKIQIRVRPTYSKFSSACLLTSSFFLFTSKNQSCMSFSCSSSQPVSITQIKSTHFIDSRLKNTHCKPCPFTQAGPFVCSHKAYQCIP